ncbi:MAG: helix-turn-helix transcriptional regulator [Bacteriovorax sp.]|nr:helix-turn-helix transcriptional regulator [Bacteriovorax sp.]
MSIKKSSVIKALDKMRGGPLTFGRMIESIRKCDEISQVELAKRMNISKAHLCDIEKGRRNVTLARAMQFAKVLGYSPIQFAAKVIEDQTREVGLKVKITLEAA